ncbi:MAG: AraC family transcriptional regulator [Epulopiscium sp.]|nr:AraC family transcriptional regulator [Candidatus Epulonipiscium sp.]
MKIGIKDKHHKRWKQNVFIKWLFYNSIVFIVTLAICMIAFFISFQIIEKEITKAHTASLTQVKQIVDDQLRKVERIYRDVSITPRIRDMMWYTGNYEPRHILSLKEIQKQLTAYKVLDPSIFECYLYFNHHDFILLDQGKYEPSTFYQFVFSHEDVSYEEWYSLVKKEYGPTYIPITLKSKSKPVTFYIHSMKFQKTFLGNFVVLIDGEMMDSVIERSKWLKDANILIMDKNNQYLSNPSEYHLPSHYTYETLEGKSGVLFDTMNNEKAVISYVQSDVNDWKYISVIPRKIFFKEAEKLLAIILIILGTCLLLSGVITYIITLKNYRPVKKIIDFIDLNWGKRYELSESEFAKIEGALEKITKEHKEMNIKMKKQEDLMREHFLERLLKGNVYTSSVNEAIQYYNLVLGEEGIAILIINVEDTSDMGLDYEETQEEIALFIIENIIGELLSESFTVEKTKVDEFIAFIISMNVSQVETFENRVEEVFQKAQSFIKENFQIVFTGAVSDCHIASSNLNVMYNEALIAYEHGMLLNHEGIQFFTQMTQSQEKNITFDLLDLERQFIYYLTARNFNKAREDFQELVNESFLDDELSFEMKKCRKYVLIHMVIEGFKKLAETQQDLDFFYQRSIPERLLKQKGIHDIYEETMGLLKEAEEYFSNDIDQNRTQEVCEKALDIIHSHLEDPNLSVSMIADTLGVSVSYVSRYFKKNVGMGALDYIHMQRIEKAKGLLKSEDINISEVAEKVGYINSLSLIRVFKKYEGITPGKYKEIQ